MQYGAWVKLSQVNYRQDIQHSGSRRRNKKDWHTILQIYACKNSTLKKQGGLPGCCLLFGGGSWLAGLFTLVSTTAAPKIANSHYFEPSLRNCYTAVTPLWPNGNATVMLQLPHDYTTVTSQCFGTVVVNTVFLFLTYRLNCAFHSLETFCPGLLLLLPSILLKHLFLYKLFPILC